MTAWTVEVTDSSTDTDGVLHLNADVLDGAVKQGTIRIAVTPDRALTVLWTQQPDTAPVSFVGAWSNV